MKFIPKGGQEVPDTRASNSGPEGPKEKQEVNNRREADDDMGSVRGTIKIESLRSFGRSKKSTKEKQVRTWQNRANENKRNPPPLVDAREEEGRRRASAAKRLSVERRKSGCGRLIMLRAG